MSVFENSVQQDALRSATHRVQPGESLSSIAEDRLGDVTQWRSLYAWNRHVVGSDPDRIFPGQQLTLAGADESDVAELNTSVDMSTLSDSALDDRIAEWMEYVDDASLDRHRAAFPHLAQLQREREMYENGVGVPLDVDSAREWYAKAAAQGQADAKKRLDELQKP